MWSGDSGWWHSLVKWGRRVEMVRLFRETLAELKIQAIVFGTDIVPTAPAPIL